MTGLVFLHGWGYGPQTWDGLAKGFGDAPVVVLDAGYFGPPDLAIPENPDGWLGVGHSLGFARLLQMDMPWRGLVGIGGFLRFCQKPDRDTGTPQAVLDAMLDAMTNAMTNAMPDDISGGLDASPAKVLARFHKRCGHSIAPLPAPGKEGLARLRADLERLRDLDLDVDLNMNLDLPARQAPTLFLHAQDDRIVPPDLPREAQSLLSCSVLTWLPSGGHALPMTRAQDCQRLIQEFLHDLG